MDKASTRAEPRQIVSSSSVSPQEMRPETVHEIQLSLH